ncbi:polysaccharide deacetylase family protein [Algoriphagus pacificus]|uniref:Polysaccharide deacetylase family protein n=1 Tax=Algoriphagus pacificus TaxID=2811234 RepID=A0ABS3CHE6_9BACT|nr:polysaccharide deacetylase family protein [Algoriphagus pacificus]MBN7815665.1 polysaccharide deacetylase family protein [Algoriphagus pacificus]
MTRVSCLLSLLISYLFFSCSPSGDQTVKSEITKWPDDKKGAVSITFDDGIINQLTIAKPILDSLGLPATFYIITGKVEGSGKGKFIGRDPQEIIKETETVRTDSSNFFERASLIAFTGTTEAEDYHARVGSMFESGRIEEAYELLDEGYEKIRTGKMRNTGEVVFHNNVEDTTSWEQYKSYAAQGHEIASHTVTHPRLAVLDEINMLYELEQSKADLLKIIGEESIFTAEGPYGTENERVMEYAHEIYPALRNRMPETWLEEINRGSNAAPGASQKEYVQWQRGILTRHSFEDMKAWIDTTLNHDNTWLVLVIHGVENLGWEPKTKEQLEEYFSFMKSKENELWIDTFRDVTKYIRARQNTQLTSTVEDQQITISLTSELDPEIYTIPLTIKTYIPEDWKQAKINGEEDLEIKEDESGRYVLFPLTLAESKVMITQ